MTIQRTHGEVEFHCDGKSCHEVYETGEKDWNTAYSEFSESDWQTRKVGREYIHICPDCIEAERPTL